VKTSSSDKKATSSRGNGARMARVLLALLACCGGSKAAVQADEVPGVSGPPLHPPVDFSFDALDDPPVTAKAWRGKPAVITFITTSSLPAQAQVDFLVAMAKHDGARVNYLAVALEGSDSREIVELYKKALSIPFPVAVADRETLAGASAFGDVSAVPVTVVLDRAGRIAWRADGRVARSVEVRAAMRGM
jgi:hypothetical protein